MHCANPVLRNLSWAMLLALAGCASAPHVSAYQQALLGSPRTLALAIDNDEQLPFGIARADVIAATEKAGFIAALGEAPRYRLFLSAAAGSAGGASFLPADDAKHAPSWIARADRSWRARAAGGGVTRVTAVLVDLTANQEVWRGTATARTRDSAAAAASLTEALLDKLPRG